MDEQKLVEIEARAKAATTDPWLHQSRGDSLDLIAEVRRLQAQCDELTHRWIKQNAADAHEAQLEASLEP